MPVRTPSINPQLFARFWLPVLGWMGFISLVSSIPGRDIPPLFPYQDAVYHLSAYLALALIFGRALANSFCDIKFAKAVFFVIIFGITCGILDEFHQRFVPGRSATVFDVSVDGIGTLFGSLFYRWQK